MKQKKLDSLGQSIFDLKYAHPNESGFVDRCRSIAKHMSLVEKDEDQGKWYDKFYDSLVTGDLVPGGRIIFGSGRNKQNLLNCYVIIPDDNVESIGKLLQDVYKISCGGGGIGFNFSKIRPKGDDIGNIKNSAPGAVSVMKLVNSIGDHVKAGKSRRTALMSMLNVDHPDLIEFLHVKLDRKELNNFNISVVITDEFIRACEKDLDWKFSFGNREYFIYKVDKTNKEGAVETLNVVALNEEDAMGRLKQQFYFLPTDTFSSPEKVKVKALDLWNRIWDNAVESGEPGIFNWSLTNSYTTASYFLKMDATNPCGEIPLESYANCCLGHVNLANMLTEDNSDVDWKRLAKTVRNGIRFLDNVLSANHYPIPETKIAGERSRRIGLGTLGLHHMLIKLGIRYGSEKCLEFLDRLYGTIKEEAYLTSMYIAREKGSFPEFDPDKYLSEEFAKTLTARTRMLIRQNGIRNAVMLTAAPTGTIAMVIGTSTGIEPIFAPMYKRRWKEGNSFKEAIVLDPMFKEALEKGEDASHIVGAYDITPEEHLAIQACVQRHIDNSISKTINLPKDANKDSSSIAKMALKFAPYLKGTTVYRAGSRGEEPLQALPLTPENIQLAKDLIAQEKASISVEGESCRIGGECGA